VKKVVPLSQRILGGIATNTEIASDLPMAPMGVLRSASKDVWSIKDIAATVRMVRAKKIQTDLMPHLMIASVLLLLGSALLSLILKTLSTPMIALGPTLKIHIAMKLKAMAVDGIVGIYAIRIKTSLLKRAGVKLVSPNRFHAVPRSPVKS
jgi:hypothetical protein